MVYGIFLFMVFIRFLGIEVAMTVKYLAAGLPENYRIFTVQFLVRFFSYYLLMTYQTVVPWVIIKYGISVYGQDGITKINRIQVLQNKLLKVLAGKKIRYSTDKLHDEFGLLKVVDFTNQEILINSIKKLISIIHNVIIFYDTLGPVAPGPRLYIRLEDQLWMRHIHIIPGSVIGTVILSPEVNFGKYIIFSLGSTFENISYFQFHGGSLNKAFIDFFTQALAEEVRGTGVTVQGVHPGMVDTNMTKGFENLINGGKGMPEIFFPKVSAFCVSAFATLGKTEYTTGYWGHGLSMYILAMIPTSLQRKMQAEENKKVYEKYLKVQKQN
ncbi:unnamed protein product, partial [Meganyctiphanes norvegica]